MIELIQTDSTVVSVDIVGAFTFTAGAEQTKTAVQDGTQRSDHKILTPPTLQIEVDQTETPIDDPEYEWIDLVLPKTPAVDQARIGAGILIHRATKLAETAIANRIAGKQETLRSYQTWTPRDRGGDLTDQLLEIYAGDELVTITYRGRTYPDLSLVNLVTNFERGAGGKTSFLLSFERIQKSQIGRVNLPNPEDLAHKAPKSLGKKKGAEGTEAAGVSEEKGTSVLKAFLG